MMNNKIIRRLFSTLVIILLLANTIFVPAVSASSAGGGNKKRTVYAINYDVQMQSYSASNSSKFPVHAGGEERYRIINTYPGTNRNTVKNSIYTITVPDSIDFTSIKDFSLLGENIRGFTSGNYNWLNEEKTSYIMDPSLYSVISDEASRTITVTIPNTSDWTSINSTSFQFSYTAPSNEENNITWNTSVYSAGGTYELVDNMELYNDLLVHYVDQDNNSVAEDTVVTDRFGTSYSAISYKKVIDGYTYDRVEGDTTATIGPNIPELTLVYSKNVVAGADVTIKYVDENNQPIPSISDKIISGNVGDAYDASTEDYQISIPGYHIDSSNLPENMIGQISENPQEIVYRYIKDKTELNVHDSTLYVGDKWSAEDNFDSALDKDGEPVDFKDITVNGNVDTSKAGTYEVTYSYDGVESKATITVLEVEEGQDLAHIVVHDSELEVGEDWLPEDNFDEATSSDGEEEYFSDIIVSGTVDTQKPGTYEVTYSIPEEHWGRGLVEGHHTATAKIVVSEKENKDSGSKGEESNPDKDNLSITDELSGENNTRNTKGLPTTGEHASALIFMIGIALLVLGSIFSVLRVKKNKK